ncbi:hypothetical protein GCM10007416_32770 [Kroppenstedtia guangzhouensis]|uniref:Uncharacterized protein n=1 Tax=Kroppenstedtia guangzhouensis TaxID=1274356 RepID=A0ABQ1H2X6_9BACL|nr:hypothetical protein GCM10007416_32770 [Kroppenstedtia guangzhouensis]
MIGTFAITWVSSEKTIQIPDLKDVNIYAKKEPQSLKVDLYAEFGDIQTDFLVNSKSSENQVKIDLVEQRLKRNHRWSND